jgi:hypothetical protein
MDFDERPFNKEVASAKASALENINSIKEIINGIESGELEGRSYYKSLSEPIEIALQNIHEYEEMANTYGEKIDNSVRQEMIQANQSLINVLFQNNDEERISELIDALPVEEMQEFDPNLFIEEESPYKKVQKGDNEKST